MVVSSGSVIVKSVTIFIGLPAQKTYLPVAVIEGALSV